MGIARSYPVRFVPRGLSDAFDATEAFDGACQSLSNLIFDQGNPEIVVSRPGVGNPLTSFAGFSSPGFISIHETIGTKVYGMISTSRNAGHDEPFCYDIASGTFVTISGITNANTPISPSSTGKWTPPTMAVIGIKIIITHPGYGGAGNFFGVIDITNPAAPAYSSANTTTNALPSVPTSVSNFNNRAYFSCGNIEYFSDVLNPTVMTNANQSLTIGDTSPISTTSGLPLQTTSGGVVSGLVVFKEFQIWQITGDLVTSNLQINYLSLNLGCVASSSVAQTPAGIHFVSIDGIYVVNPLGYIHPLSHEAGQPSDIRNPFINASQPSRIAGSFSGNIYRVCFDTIIQGQSVTNDYWFDTTRRRWSGPHSFPYDGISQAGNYFVLSSYLLPGKLFKSQIIPDLNSTYFDNGIALNVSLQSSSLPKRMTMTEKSVTETTVELSSAGISIVYSITCNDDQGNTLGLANVMTKQSGTLWGSFIWGDGTLWGSSINAPHVYDVNWTAPLVFKKLVVNIRATASINLAIGSFFFRYQDLGYTNKG